MKKVLVYDTVVRIFHIIFIFTFLFSFIVAKTVDDESLLYCYHMISGLIMGAAILGRIAWGLMGSRYARFSDMPFHPKKLLEYLLSLPQKEAKKFAGHNPASSWAMLGFFALGLLLTMSGIMMASGYKEEVEDIHELFANGMILLVIAHILGVAAHTLKHKDPIALSMVSGEKNLEQNDASIPHSYLPSGIIYLLIISLFAGYLFSNFERTTKTLQIGKINLQLGESDSEDSGDEEVLDEAGE